LSFVSNENILQACATVFAGVLILLTLERKFEAKDVQPEYIHKLIRDYEELSSLLKDLQNKHTQIKQRIINEEKPGENGFRLHVMKQERDAIEGRLEKVKNDLRLTDNTVKQVREQQMISKEEELRAQRLKDVEDLMTLITLALFSLCIVFMIFVDTEWSYTIFNYSVLSKFLFSLALLVLLIRVYLRSKEFKTYRIPFLHK
jgi:hypothetical protein